MSTPIITPQLWAQARAQQAAAPNLPVPNLLPSSAPMAGMAAVPNFGSPAPAANVVGAPTQAQRNVAARDALVAHGDGISSISNPWLRGFARVADVVGHTVAPAIEQYIPGTMGNHAHELAKANAQIAVDQREALNSATLQDQQAQAEQRQALATQEEAKAEALTDPHPKPLPGHLVLGADGTAAGYQDGDGNFMGLDDPALPHGVKDVADNLSPKIAKVAPGDEKLDAAEAARLNGVWNSLADKHHLPKGQFAEGMTRADATALAQNLNNVVGKQQGDTRVIIQQDRPEASGTWTPGVGADGRPVMFNNKSGEVRPLDGGFTKGPTAGQSAKINSDEQKRADLAQNLNENLDAYEKILNRRPDLFGPFAGRTTELKAHFGTNDPDITQLEAIQHQLAMVQQGVHGMRSSQGLESAAHSLTGGYHNSPEATLAALEAARASSKTFLEDSQAPGKARSGDSASSGGSPKADYVYVPGKGLVKQ